MIAGQCSRNCSPWIGICLIALWGCNNNSANRTDGVPGENDANTIPNSDGGKTPLPDSELSRFVTIIDAQTLDFLEDSEHCDGPLADTSWTDNKCGLRGRPGRGATLDMCEPVFSSGARPCYHAENGFETPDDWPGRFYMKPPKGDYLQASKFPDVERMNAICFEYEFEGFEFEQPVRNTQCRNCGGSDGIAFDSSSDTARTEATPAPGPQITAGLYHNLAGAGGSTHNGNEEGWHYYLTDRQQYLPHAGRVWLLNDDGTTRNYAMCFPNIVQQDRTRSSPYRPFGPPFGADGNGTVWTLLTYLYWQPSNANCKQESCTARLVRTHGLEIRDHMFLEPHTVFQAQANETYRFDFHTDFEPGESLSISLWQDADNLPLSPSDQEVVAWIDGDDDGVYDYDDRNNNNRCDKGEDIGGPDHCLLSNSNWVLPDAGDYVLRVKINNASPVQTLNLCAEDGLECETLYLSTGEQFEINNDGATPQIAALQENIRGGTRDAENDADHCLVTHSCGE